MQSQLEQDRKEEYRLDAEKDAESYDDDERSRMRKHPYQSEVISLLERLTVKYDLDSVNDGEELFKVKNVAEATDSILSVDESHLYVISKTEGNKEVLFIVLGNEPGLAVCDYSSCHALDAITEAHCDEWGVAAGQDRIKELEAAHCKAMERAMADVVRVDKDNAKLREQLAKADQHIKLHCSDLASSIIQDSNQESSDQQWSRPVSTTARTASETKKR